MLFFIIIPAFLPQRKKYKAHSPLFSYVRILPQTFQFCRAPQAAPQGCKKVCNTGLFG